MTQKSRVVVFDLDDTLYKEQDYLQSAYREISAVVESRYSVPEGVSDQMFRWWQKGENVFQQLIETYELKLTVDELLRIYRSHVPAIRLEESVGELLRRLRQHAALGIITDGRSLTQRHKVEALGLTAYMDEQDILISEETGYGKPSDEPFRWLMERHPSGAYYYIGDNPAKDFEAPNRLGWTTVCLLDDGRNIHRQDFSLPPQMLPQYKVPKLSEIENIII
jgi:putative hydrolase of the HAD superfamily